MRMALRRPVSFFMTPGSSSRFDSTRIAECVISRHNREWKRQRALA